MKVILLENLKRIGSIGEVIDVKRGFARNFLIANKKALYASKENIKQVEKIKLDLLSLGYQKFGNLITDNNRFSCLRDLASIYVEIDNSKISNSSNSKDFLRKIFFESWRNEAPEKWHSKSALDGNLEVCKFGDMMWNYIIYSSQNYSIKNMIELGLEM